MQLHAVPPCGSQGFCAGGTGACIDSIFGPTAADYYWSSSDTSTASPIAAWLVSFYSGFTLDFGKLNHLHVRAVRGGP